MASDCHRRKPLLYSDLFKCHRNKVPEKEKDSTVVSKLESSSWSSSSCSQSSSSCSDSSSSGFSTPLFSETEDEQYFFAELTRQMAEFMLQEEEEEEDEESAHPNRVSEDSEANNNEHDDSHADSGAINNAKNGLYSSSPIQVYQLGNQPPVREQGPVCQGEGGVKWTESAQRKQFQKTEQHHLPYGGIGHGRNWDPGSGMQAVFLGGSRSRTGSPGTGVFLPRIAKDPTKLKRKSGCSMVLVPTRVLQVLESHFNRLEDSIAPPLSGGSPSKGESTVSNGLGNGASSQLESLPVASQDEMQLPQEWTY